MNTSSYDIILSLPLFAGIGKEELLEIAAHNRLDFRKYSKGEPIAKRGERCLELLFVIFGDITIRKYSASDKYNVEERLRSPWLIQPDRLYGLRQVFTEDVFALTDCNVLSIDKKTVNRICDLSLAFKINFLNSISTHQQTYEDEVWKENSGNITDLLKRFFVIHSTPQSYASTFYITMNALADEINASRLEISQSLNEMQRKGLLTLSRARIDFQIKAFL